MEDLKLISLPDLLDLLVEKTAQYLGMIHGKGSQEDLQKCRELMTALQLEIENRRAKKNSSPQTISSPDPVTNDVSNEGVTNT